MWGEFCDNFAPMNEKNYDVTEWKVIYDSGARLIVQDEIVVMDVSLFRDDVVAKLVNMHNNACRNSFNKGLDTYAKVVKSIG